MADQKISALTSATTPLAGTEVLPIVQGGATVKVSVANLTAGRDAAVNTLSSIAGVWIGTTAPVYSELLNILSGANSPAYSLVRNTNAGSSAYSGHYLNASGNAWGIRMGSSAANSNALECVIDAVGSPVIKSSLSTSGVLTLSNYGAGAATFSAAGVISSVSDENWKRKDGVPLDPVGMLKGLQPGYWYYNEEKAPIFGAERQLGFYAQNVRSAIGPEAAPTPEKTTQFDADGNQVEVTKPWGYHDRSVLAVTVMALQKALERIEALEQQLNGV
jgi:hypothetical protein